MFISDTFEEIMYTGPYNSYYDLYYYPFYGSFVPEDSLLILPREIEINMKGWGGYPIETDCHATKVLHLNGSKIGEGYMYKLDENNNAIITGTLSNDTDIVIPSDVDGYTVVGIGDEAFKEDERLSSISLPEYVRTIGDKAFYGCTSLVSVGLPQSLESIGVATFYNCTSLVSVDLPQSVESIPNSAFWGCESIANLDISDTVTSIGSEAFALCTGLENVVIPSSVVDLGSSAFWKAGSEDSRIEINCNIPDSDINDGVFENSHFKTVLINGTGSIGRYAFCGSGAESVEIGNGITSINGCAFALCEKLSSVIIPTSVTDIQYRAFEDCEVLDLTVPDSVANISSSAFDGVPHVTYHGSASGKPWGAVAIN